MMAASREIEDAPAVVKGVAGDVDWLKYVVQTIKESTPKGQVEGHELRLAELDEERADHAVRLPTYQIQVVELRQKNAAFEDEVAQLKGKSVTMEAEVRRNSAAMELLLQGRSLAEVSSLPFCEARQLRLTMITGHGGHEERGALKGRGWGLG